jgi:hypothetical protein
VQFEWWLEEEGGRGWFDIALKLMVVGVKRDEDEPDHKGD